MANARITTARTAISRIALFARFFRRGRIVLRSFIDGQYIPRKERPPKRAPTTDVCDLSFDQADFFFLMHWPAAFAAFLAALASALVG
jgi:hypothetical protein